MTVCKFIRKLLHLKGLLVSDFQFKFREIPVFSISLYLVIFRYIYKNALHLF